MKEGVPVTAGINGGGWYPYWFGGYWMQEAIDYEGANYWRIYKLQIEERDY